MTTSLFRTLKATLWRHRSSQKGFTLVELLIVTLIAGGIVSGLMFLVVELLTADQRDASRNATQQDMQRALDYMSTELRDAVYVYSGNTLYNNILNNNRLPANLRTPTSTPVIAFWKQSPLPSNVIAYCAANSLNVDEDGNPAPIPDAAGNPIPCATAHAYSLVVYSLNTDTPPNSPWSGRARITRYELRPYNNNPGQPTPVPGYVNPIVGLRNLFASWPLDTNGTTNRQTARPTGTAVPLTDFVDVDRGTPACPPDTDANGNPVYQMSPPPDQASDSFYACVNTSVSAAPSASTSTRVQSDAIENQEVLLFLRGNGFGRPSINDADGNSSNSYRPALSTRVFNRGTLDINPAQDTGN